MSASTVTFAGSQLWSDSSTGRGPIWRFRQGKLVRWAVIRIPGEAKIAKNLGAEPGRLQLALNYWMTDSERASLETTLDGLVGTLGSLVVASNTGTETVTNCILVDRGDARAGVVFTPPSTTARQWQYFLTFEKLS